MRLEALAEEAKTNLADALTYARKTLEWLGPEEAIPCYQAVLDRNSLDLAAHYELGILLLDQGDDQGAYHLEQVMEIEPIRTAEVCQGLKRYFLQRGNIDMAKKYVAIAEQRSRLVASQQKKR